MKFYLFELLFSLLFYLFLGPSTSASFIPQSFNVEFQQVYKSSVSGQVKKRDGLLFYKYPSNIRLELKAPPVRTVFVSNKKKSWYYTAPFLEGQQGDVIISRAGKKDFVKIFDLLKQGLKNNKSYHVTRKKEIVELSFNKKYRELLGLSKLILKFKKSGGKDFKNLMWIEFIYLKKKPVKMTLEAFNLVPNLRPETFHFKVPKNTNISNQFK